MTLHTSSLQTAATYLCLVMKTQANLFFFFLWPDMHCFFFTSQWSTIQFWTCPSSKLLTSGEWLSLFSRSDFHTCWIPLWSKSPPIISAGFRFGDCRPGLMEPYGLMEQSIILLCQKLLHSLMVCFGSLSCWKTNDSSTEHEPNGVACCCILPC